MITDLRHALRALSRRPAATTAAVLTLGLGIGANVAVFSLVYAVLLAPMAIQDADRVVSVTERRESTRDADLPVSGHEFAAWAQANAVFEQMALTRGDRLHFTGVHEPEAVDVLHVSAEYFPLLGVPAARGHVYAPGADEPYPEPVAVLSDGFSRRRFGTTDVVGRTIMLNDRPFTVIGVMPPLPASLTPAVWLPIDVPAQVLAVGRHNLNVLARLAPGKSVEDARADLASLSLALERERPADNAGHGVSVKSLRQALTGDFRRPLLVLTLAVALVMLIACANVANLLLAQSSRRRHEFALRAALGAGRWRITRQLLIESLVLALTGAVAGVVLAVWIVDAASTSMMIHVPLMDEARVDGPTLSFAVIATMFAALAAGAAPAFRWARVHPGAVRVASGATGDGGNRLRSALVAGQVALTLTLLAATALLAGSLLRLSRVDPGFSTEGVLVTPIDLPGSRYPEAHQRRAFVEQLTDQLRDAPGIESVGVVSHLPLGGSDNWMMFSLDGQPPARPGEEPYAPFRVASTGYFEAMRIPLLRGRLFDDRDARQALPLVRWYPQQPDPEGLDRPQAEPVALVSETAARRFWGDADPVGRRIRVLFSPPITVVGVVGDVRHIALDQPIHPHVYLSHNQEPWASVSLVVRATERSAFSAIRDRIHALDAGLPVPTRPMSEVRSESIGRPRFHTVLVALFTGAALSVALVGVSGVVSCFAAQRTREIGVRIALGARPIDIIRMVVGQGMRPVAAGLLAGIVGALLLSRFIAALLFDVDPADPATLVAVLVLLATVSSAACFFPAARAARMDPLKALRAE